MLHFTGLQWIEHDLVTEDDKYHTWKTEIIHHFYLPLHESHSMVNKARKVKEGHTNWKRRKNFSHSVVVCSGNSIAQAENEDQDKWKKKKNLTKSKKKLSNVAIFKATTQKSIIFLYYSNELFGNLNV